MSESEQNTAIAEPAPPEAESKAQPAFVRLWKTPDLESRIFQLSNAASKAYLCLNLLAEFRRSRAGRIVFRCPELARNLSVSEKTLRDALRELREQNLVMLRISQDRHHDSELLVVHYAGVTHELIRKFREESQRTTSVKSAGVKSTSELTLGVTSVPTSVRTSVETAGIGDATPFQDSYLPPSKNQRIKEVKESKEGATGELVPPEVRVGPLVSSSCETDRLTNLGRTAGDKSPAEPPPAEAADAETLLGMIEYSGNRTERRLVKAAAKVYAENHQSLATWMMSTLCEAVIEACISEGKGFPPELKALKSNWQVKESQPVKQVKVTASYNYHDGNGVFWGVENGQKYRLKDTPLGQKTEAELEFERQQEKRYESGEPF